jgi:CRP-like cAMP-binding protein
MSDAAGYALHRPDILDALERGEAAIARAMAAQPPKLVRAGEAIMQAGEAHERVYRLRTGWLARTRPLPDGRKQIILVFLPGDLLGTKCMYLTRQPDAIEALSDATLEWIDYRALRELVRRDPDAATRTTWQAMEDERRLHNWVVGLGQGDAEERMAQMVLDFRARLRRLGLSRDDTYRLPMTQQQLGDYLGLTTVHVNRVLKRLREAGLLSIRRQTVTIEDVAALERMAWPVQDVFERTRPGFSGPEAAG